MAILDGVKNAVTSQVAARANSSIRSGLTKVAGNLLGINTQFDGPSLGSPQARAENFYSKTRFTTESLMYPMDVQEDPRQGHYIFFNINVQDKGKIAERTFISNMEYHEKQIEAEYQHHIKTITAAREEERAAGQDFLTQIRSREELKKEYIQKHIIDQYGGRGVEFLNKGSGNYKSAYSESRPHSSSLQLQHPTTKRIDTAIALYMPPSVQVSYAAEYNDTEIGILADVGAGIIQAFKEGADTKETAMEAFGKFEVGAKKLALAALDVAAPGSKALVQIQTGKAITPKMELMFNGIGRREFSYEFTFIPKSQTEAEMVQRIVKKFKYHMASNFIEGTGNREMEIPSTFDISYHYMGKPNESLNKISTCVLEQVDVSYGGDRFQAYADGVPQQTKLNLKFKEMEIITKRLIDEGY